MTTTLAQSSDGDTDETIRKTVRALRSAHEVDAAVLAANLGISRQSLYNRLNGNAPWLAAEIAGLARFFGCAVQDLYDGRILINRAATSGVSAGYPARNARSVAPLSLVRGTNAARVTRCDRLGRLTEEVSAA